MRIDVQTDSAPLVLRLANGQRRLAYAVVNAINATAKRVQQAEFEQVRGAFQIRRPNFFFGTPARPGGTAARIRPFASVMQGRPYAEVAIQAPEGRGLVSRRTLLPMFEEGGTRPVFTPGAQSIAVPVTGGPARPTFADPVAPQFTFARLRFVDYQGGQKVQREGQRAGRRDKTLYGTEGRMTLPTRGGLQWRGAQRTFIATSSKAGAQSGALGGVFQRVGPGRGGIRPVYVFRHPMHLAQRLRWVATAQHMADVWFKAEMEE